MKIEKNFKNGRNGHPDSVYFTSNKFYWISCLEGFNTRVWLPHFWNLGSFYSTALKQAGRCKSADGLKNHPWECESGDRTMKSLSWICTWGCQEEIVGDTQLIWSRLKLLKVKSHSCVRLFETPWTVLEWEGIFMSVFQRHEHRSLIRYLKPMTWNLGKIIQKP